MPLNENQSMKSIVILVLVASWLMLTASTNLAAESNNAAWISDKSEPPALRTVSLRDYLEMFSFGATIITAVVAVFALRQLRLARLQLDVASATLKVAQDDIKTRSRREAVSLAAKHCEDYGDVILQKFNAWRNEITAKGINLKTWALQNKSFDETSLKNASEAHAWIQQMQTKQLGATACKILNQCEAFAVYFATGAADEEVAYPVVGSLFCHEVEMFAPWLIAMRTHSASNYTSGKYANTVRLYEIWADRIRVEEIEAQTKRTQQELGTLKKEKIKPIGTD